MKLRIDLQFFAGEKTEKATPKKRKDTRKRAGSKKRGCQYRHFFIGSIPFAYCDWSVYERQVAVIYRNFYTESLTMKLSESNVHTLFISLLEDTGIILAPILLVALVAGVVSNYMQVGFLFSAEVIQPKLEKLDPIKGFKRIYSMRAIVELIKSILKITVVGFAAFAVLWSHYGEILRLRS